MSTKSDRNTQQEVQGAEYCVLMLGYRSRWSKRTCQWYGEQVYKRYITKNPGFADGFREMAYIVAKQRGI
jgi:hypothetical protein